MRRWTTHRKHDVRKNSSNQSAIIGNKMFHWCSRENLLHIGAENSNNQLVQGLTIESSPKSNSHFGEVFPFKKHKGTDMTIPGRQKCKSLKKILSAPKLSLHEKN